MFVKIHGHTHFHINKMELLRKPNFNMRMIIKSTHTAPKMRIPLLMATMEHFDVDP